LDDDDEDKTTTLFVFLVVERILTLVEIELSVDEAEGRCHPMLILLILIGQTHMLK